MHSKQTILLLLTLLLCQLGFAQGKTETTNITLKAVPGLKFDQLRFSVKPGANVNLTLINNDDMDHNLLITKPGKRQHIVDAAAALQDQGPQMDFIPVSDAILWTIPVIGPGEKQSINFVAPTKTGAYPYVCTYPGHGLVMFGVMYVTDKELPPLTSDPHVPQIHKENASNHKGHAEKTTPYLYRTFIDDIGPAVIAVRLTNNLSYAWDAAECRFRYAWTGQFLNMDKLWAGHKQATAIVLGEKQFIDQSEYPLRIGKSGNIPDVELKGYKLFNRYPEFHYTINGIDVYELIKDKKDGSGLIRSFRIPDARQNVWFDASSNQGTIHSSTAGSWSKGMLKLTPQEAKSFQIIMIKKK